MNSFKKKTLLNIVLLTSSISMLCGVSNSLKNIDDFTSSVDIHRQETFSDPMFQYIADNFDPVNEKNLWGVYHSPWMIDLKHSGADFDGDGDITDEYWYESTNTIDSVIQSNEYATYSVEDGFKFQIGVKYNPEVDVITNDKTSSLKGEEWQKKFFVDQMPSPDYLAVDTPADTGSYVWGSLNGQEYGSTNPEWVWTDGTSEETSLEGLTAAEAAPRGYWKLSMNLDEGWDIMPGMLVQPMVYDHTLNEFQFTWSGLEGKGYDDNPWTTDEIYTNSTGTIYDGATIFMIKLTTGAPFTSEAITEGVGEYPPEMIIPKMQSDTPEINVVTSITPEGVTFFTQVFANSETKFYHSNEDVVINFYPTIEDPETSMFTAEAEPLTITNYELIVDGDIDNSTYMGVNSNGKEFFTWEQLNGGLIEEGGAWESGSSWLSGRLEITSPNLMFETGMDRYTWAIGTIDAEGIDEIVQMMVQMTIDGTYNEEIMNAVDEVISNWYLNEGGKDTIQEEFLELKDELKTWFQNYVSSSVITEITNISEQIQAIINELEGSLLGEGGIGLNDDLITEIQNNLHDSIHSEISNIFGDEDNLALIKAVIIEALENEAGKYVEEWVLENGDSVEQLIVEGITDGIDDALETVTVEDIIAEDVNKWFSDNAEDIYNGLDHYFDDLFNDEHYIYDRETGVSQDANESDFELVTEEVVGVDGKVHKNKYYDFNNNGHIDMYDGIYESNVAFGEDGHLYYDFNWDNVGESENVIRGFDFTEYDPDERVSEDETPLMLTSYLGTMMYKYLNTEGLDDALGEWVNDYLWSEINWEYIFDTYDNDTVLMVISIIGFSLGLLGTGGLILTFVNRKKIKDLEFALSGGVKVTTVTKTTQQDKDEK